MKSAASIWKKYGPWLLLVLLVLSLIPILLLGRYDWPSADDYSYAFRAREALVNGKSVLGAAWHNMWGYYDTWQGTFVALGLMTLTPLAFSEHLYWLTPVVMAGMVCLGTFKLSDTLARRALGSTWRQTVFLAAPILLLSLQFVPSPKDTLYWWNGAVYYTFIYGVMLLLVERMAAIKLASTRRQTLWAVIPGSLAALMVGGSNYVSALLAVLVCGLLLLWFLWRERSKFLPALIPTAVLCLCFLVSVAAPGNGVRQSQASEPIGAVEAVLRSIQQAWSDLLDWFNWPILLVFLLMIPLLWGLTGRVKCTFPLPPLFSAFTFLLFAAQNAPHFYALGEAGPERLRSIVFYSFFWLVILNLWYWLGWVRRAVYPWLAGGEKLLRRTWWAVPAALVLLTVTTAGFGYYRGCTAGRCAAALTDGSAGHYLEQQLDRLALYEDPELADVRVAPLEVEENLRTLLFNGDVHQDPDMWVNQAVAQFYGKNTVALAP